MTHNRARTKNDHESMIDAVSVSSLLFSLFWKKIPSSSSTMESFLQSICANKFEDDTREPDLFLNVPYGGGTIGITGVDPMFWNQLILILLLESVVSVAAAVVIYTLIVKHRGFTSAYLVGYGFVCPILLYVPFYLVYFLDLRNTALKIATATSPCLLFFRTLEAIYGTVPAFANESLGNFVLYYIAPIQFEFDAKTKKPVLATRSDLARKAIQCNVLFLQTMVFFSVLAPYNYRIFPTRTIHSPLDLFYWGNLCNNYILAYLTSLCLEVGSVGIGLVTSLLSGISTVDLNDNPLTKSTSPSDFWGNRWNKLVSSGMKRGVFVPLRMANFSRPTAALATFAASGLLHEYILTVMSINVKDVHDIPVQNYGSHLAFFLWNGTVLVMEHLLKGHAVVTWIQKHLPAPIRTALVVLTVLPVAMLFTDAYIDNGFYSHFALGFPRLIRVDGVSI
jgi:hypothetical protein